MPLEEKTIDKQEPSLDGLAFDITEKDIASAAGELNFEKSGSVQMDTNLDYIEFKNEDLLKKLKVFVQKKAISRDIITKSLRILPQINDSSVSLSATDGISFLFAKVPAVVNKFSGEVIIDAESFNVVARTHSAKSYLIHKGGKFFSDFYGGEIFIPTYKIASNVFQKDFGKPVLETQVDAAILHEALTSLASVLVSSEVPELGYVFIDTDGMYSSNGILIAKVAGNLPSLVIRQSDVNIISLLLEAIQNEAVFITEYKEFYSVSSQSFGYVFPKVTAKLSQQYKDAVHAPKTGKFFVNLPYIHGILNILSQMPDNSGIVDFNFSDDLQGISKTKKGEESNFVITSSKEGDVQKGKFGVSVKAILVALRVLKNESAAAFAYEDGKLIISTEKKQCVILLKR